MHHRLRVVIDTNVFVSAYISQKGLPAKIVDSWIKGIFELCVSDAILDEYFAVLLRIGIPPPLVRLLNRRISKHAKLVKPSISLTKMTKDPSDSKFLECAVEGNADFIITGDRHLLDLGKFEEIKIVIPAEFLKLIN